MGQGLVVQGLLIGSTGARIVGRQATRNSTMYFISELVGTVALVAAAGLLLLRSGGLL